MAALDHGLSSGGAEPPPGAIPVAEARNRLWKNFEEAKFDDFGSDPLLLFLLDDQI